MLYSMERQKVLDIVEAGLKFDLLEMTGGTVSLRLPDGNILITATGLAFRRWEMSLSDMIVLDPQGAIVEQTGALGVAETPIHLTIYKQLPKCNAIFHCHSHYATMFASVGAPVTASTNQVDTLGEVPCIVTDDQAIKNAVRSGEIKVEMPPGMLQRMEVAAINMNVIAPAVVEVFKDRADELDRHGLAFTAYRHGLFTLGRNVDEALENAYRVEASAKISIGAMIIKASGASMQDQSTSS